MVRSCNARSYLGAAQMPGWKSFLGAQKNEKDPKK
jgi:hypothetical protein